MEDHQSQLGWQRQRSVKQVMVLIFPYTSYPLLRYINQEESTWIVISPSLSPTGTCQSKSNSSLSAKNNELLSRVTLFQLSSLIICSKRYFTPFALLEGRGHLVKSPWSTDELASTLRVGNCSSIFRKLSMIAITNKILSHFWWGPSAWERNWVWFYSMRWNSCSLQPYHLPPSSHILSHHRVNQPFSFSLRQVSIKYARIAFLSG